MSDNEYKILKLICNMITLCVSVFAICFLEYMAISKGIDGVAFSFSIAIIAVIAGVKSKDIREIIKGTFWR